MIDRLKQAWQAFQGVQEKKAIMGELSVSNPQRLFSLGYGTQSYNPSELVTRKGLGIFDKMRLDDQVRAALHYKKQAILSSGWEIDSPRDQDERWEVTLFVEDALRHMDTPVEEMLLGILTAMDYGYSVSEKIYGEYDGKIYLDAVKTRKPHSFTFDSDEFGNLNRNGLLQETPDDSEKRLPPDKFVIFQSDKEFGNWYGKSDLEIAYRPWWSKDNAYRWMMQALEKYGIPPLFALYDPNKFSKTQVTELKSIVSRMQASTTGVIASPQSPSGEKAINFWTPELAEQVASVFIPVIESLNRDIARSLLLPSLVGDGGGSEGEGSFARARVQFDLFLMTIGYIQRRIEREVMQQQVIKPLVDLNFAGVEQYPLFKFRPIDQETKVELMTAWITAVEKGIVAPQPQDEDYFRGAMGFPERTEIKTDKSQVEIIEDKKEEIEDKKEETIQSDYAQEVNFDRIDKALDSIELVSKAAIIKVLEQSRDSLIGYIGKNYDGLMTLVPTIKIKGMADLQLIIKEFLRKSYDAGEKEASMEIKTKYYDQDFAPQDALDWLDLNGVVITGVIKDTVLNNVKTILMNAIKEGWEQSTTVRELKDYFVQFIGDESVLKDGKEIPAHRLETIVRTNATRAFNQGRLIAINRDRTLVNGVKYSAILDSRTTEVCRHLNGRVFRADDPALAALAPPRHFNCRSILVPVPLDIKVDQQDFITQQEIGRAYDESEKGF